MGKRVKASAYYSRRAGHSTEEKEPIRRKQWPEEEDAPLKTGKPEERKETKGKTAGQLRKAEPAMANAEGGGNTGNEDCYSGKPAEAAGGKGSIPEAGRESGQETGRRYDRRKDRKEKTGSDRVTHEKAGMTKRDRIPPQGDFHMPAGNMEKLSGATPKRQEGTALKIRPLNSLSPALKSVSGDLNKAVSGAKERKPDEVRELTAKLIGVEALAAGEVKSAGLVGKLTENAVRTTGNTAAFFTGKESAYHEYREYRRQKKELKTLRKNIREWKKEEALEPEPVLKGRYRLKQRKAETEINSIKKKHKAARKTLAAKRHTRSIKSIRNRTLSDIKGAGKEIIKIPNRMTLMVSSDLEAEKIAAKAGAGIGGVLLKGTAEVIKAYLAALKSVLKAISPVLFVTVLITFMMYIMFFSDFESAFDLSISRDDLTGEAAENDLNAMIMDSLTDRREEMAAELVAADQSVQVYFLPIPDAVISRAASLIRERASTEGNPSVLFDQWLSTEDAAQTVLQTAVCYVLPEEEEAACEEAELVAYSGNIPPPEPETEPPTEPETEPPTEPEGGITGIGAGIGIGIGMGTGNSEPEPETEPVTEPETENRAVIGYHVAG